jgi:hypothetical protein
MIISSSQGVANNQIADKSVANCEIPYSSPRYCHCHVAERFESVLDLVVLSLEKNRT